MVALMQSTFAPLIVTCSSQSHTPAKMGAAQDLSEKATQGADDLTSSFHNGLASLQSYTGRYDELRLLSHFMKAEFI
jgi:hypothetical protein